MGNHAATARQKSSQYPCGWVEGDVYFFQNSSVIRHDNTGTDVGCEDPDPTCDAGYHYDTLTLRCEVDESPILIDTTPARMSGEAHTKLTSADYGVLFDIDADGTLDRIAWVKDGSKTAFLAIDRNGNGIIDDGSELFGSATIPGVGNGFKALAQLETHNRNGTLDSADSLFAKLLLWNDRNEDGFSTPDELSPASANLDGIGLGYTLAQETDRFGNQFKYKGWAIAKGPGSTGAREFVIFDVIFKRLR